MNIEVGGVGPDGVIGGSPGVDERPSADDAAEQMLVEAFVMEPADEALDEPCLLRLARCDVVPQRRPLFLPD